MLKFVGVCAFSAMLLLLLGAECAKPKTTPQVEEAVALRPRDHNNRNDDQDFDDYFGDSDSSNDRGNNEHGRGSGGRGGSNWDDDDKGSNIFDIDFGNHELKKFNPSSRKNEGFEWNSYEINDRSCSANGNQDEDGTLQLDNGIFIRGGDNDHDSKSDFIDFASLPFGRWLPQNLGPNVTRGSYDGSVRSRDALEIGSGERIRGRLVFGCETYGTEYHPFSDEAVSDAKDDPRLGACSMSLTDKENGVELSYFLTNNGVWAQYGRSAATKAANNENYLSFQIYRRVAKRSNNNFVDARISVDRDEAHFYLGNRKVWSINDLGKLTEEVRNDRKNVLVREVAGRNEASAVKSVVLFVENTHKMDIADPNNEKGNNKLGLVRLTNERGYYGNYRFDDERSKRSSVLFHQGARASLKRLRVDRIRSGRN